MRRAGRGAGRGAAVQCGPVNPKTRVVREIRLRGGPVRPNDGSDARPAGGRFILQPSALRRADISSGGLRFPAAAAPTPVEPEPKPEREPKVKVKVKNDPRLVAAARELRDRWLEQFNRDLADGELTYEAKYDVARRQLAGRPKKSRLLMNPRAA